MKKLKFDLQIRRSSRISQARIVVSPAKVEVIVPLTMQDQNIYRFVSDKQNWIENALDKLSRRNQEIPALAPENYVEGAEIPYQGKKYRLSLVYSQAQQCGIEFQEGFKVTIPAGTIEKNQHELLRGQLTLWMQRQALIKAEEYVRWHGDKFQLFPRSIKIKKLRSRWGSCGKNNDMHLNWVLILASEKILEYVVVHELCHIRHRNHSNDFWILVAAHLPDYKQHRHWLKVHGSGLIKGL